ncbi:MAG: hypothetical protein GWO24_32245, partial [Akkermansiaceae bacterium]|nr:hypothetical protein [Akkermansiaceae bacterium]
APPEDRRKERFRAHGAEVIRQAGSAFEAGPDLEGFADRVLVGKSGKEANDG